MILGTDLCKSRQFEALAFARADELRLFVFARADDLRYWLH